MDNKQKNEYSIENFIAAPTTDKAGDFQNGFDTTIGDFISKPDATEDRTRLREMHPELLGGFEDKPDRFEPKKGGLKSALKIIIPVLLILGIALVILLNSNGQDKDCDKEYSLLHGLISQNGEDTYSAIHEKNSDMVGYLTLNDKGYPVVKPNNNNQEYYQSHLFTGKSNKYGTLYTNSNVEVEGFPPVTAIYGAGIDNRMLGFVKEYQNEAYSKKNPTIKFDTLSQNGEWVAFSAFSFEGAEPFLMDRLSFLNEGLQEEYVNNFYKNSKIEFDIDAAAGDKFLVLIANDQNKAHVAAFRLMREGETKDSLTKKLKDVVADTTENSSKKEETTSDTKAESNINTPSSKPSYTVSEPKDQPIINTEKRYEQTGLTENMDKTVKVDVAPVVTMSNVVGMTKQGAINLLENTLGFPVNVVEVESTEKRGTVIEQSVAEGAEISTDNTVTITVSIGISGGKAMVPDLIGSARATVEILLDKNLLTLGKVTEQKSSLEKGTIISQSIDADTEVTTNTKIDIVVSDGKGEIITVKMPNLSGKTKKSASAAIKKAGLKVGKISTITSSKTAGTVVSQEVPSGKKVAEGETVGFSISNGSKVNNLTVTNQSSWSVKINGKTYAPGAYIKGDYMDIIPYIVEAEMGSGFNTEALKAQAVAAYCWLINAGSTKGSAPGVPMKNPSGKTINAVSEVNGQKVKYGSETAQTYYYAISAGYSANCKDVWWADIPYLRAVESQVDKDYQGFETTVTYSAQDLQNRVSNTYGINLSGISKSKWFSIKYDENNAYVRSVSIAGKKNVTGSSFRDELLDYELRSTAFKVKYNKSSDTFKFTVRGFGHGVGLSQVGANYYAAAGWSYVEILKHYYPGTTIG